MNIAEKFLEQETIDLTIKPDNGEFLNTGTDEIGLVQFEDGSGLLYWGGDKPSPYWPKPVRSKEIIEKFKKGEIYLYQLKREG